MKQKKDHFIKLYDYRIIKAGNNSKITESNLCLLSNLWLICMQQIQRETFRNWQHKHRVSNKNGNLGEDPQAALVRSQASSTSGDKGFPWPTPSWHRALEGLSKSQHKKQECGHKDALRIFIKLWMSQENSEEWKVYEKQKLKSWQEFMWGGKMEVILMVSIENTTCAYWSCRFKQEQSSEEQKFYQITVLAQKKN